MLDVNSVSKRLEHLLNYYNEHEQGQVFATTKRRITDGIDSFRLFGIGFDRWHFLSFYNRGTYWLVSLFHVSEYYYIGDFNADCKVCHLVNQRNKINSIFRRLINDGQKEKEHHEKKKITQRERKLSKLQSAIDALKRGEKVNEFINPVGKKIRK